MRTKITYMTLCIVLLICVSTIRSWSHIYIVIYATLDGKTGHAGIAIDNYDIITTGAVEDTVSNGTLTYFDLWPSKDDFGLFSFSKDQEAVYYKLPNAIWSEAITLNILYDKGIPHREDYPADAILKLKTRPHQDYSLSDYLGQVMAEKKVFNPRFYNCTDFVNDALSLIMGAKLKVREFIPFSYTSTPNKLCRALLNLPETIVIKSPGSRINGSFFRERVLEKRKRKDDSMFTALQ